GLAPPEVVPERLHLEERQELAEPEVLEDAAEDQHGEMLPARVTAERDLLEQDGGDRQEDAEEDREDEEQQEEVEVQDPEEVRQRQGDVAQDLDERAEQLEQDEVRHRHPAD